MIFLSLLLSFVSRYQYSFRIGLIWSYYWDNILLSTHPFVLCIARFIPVWLVGRNSVTGHVWASGIISFAFCNASFPGLGSFLHVHIVSGRRLILVPVTSSLSEWEFFLFFFFLIESSSTLPMPSDFYHRYRSSFLLPARMAMWMEKALAMSEKSMG